MLVFMLGTTLPGTMVSDIYQHITTVIKDYLYRILGISDLWSAENSGWELDILGHFLLFFLLSLCALHGYGKARPLAVRLALVLLATATEVIQAWIPDRTVSPVDFLLDVSSLFLASILLLSVCSSQTISR